MSELVLVHWKPEEAADGMAILASAGHDVRLLDPPGPAGLRSLRESLPDAVLIDLTRIPSQGRAVGVALRQGRATRGVPLVFVGGVPAKVELVRRQFPDAVFTEWRTVRSAVRRAIANPPPDPVVPGTMSGYSGTPLPKKLGVRAGETLMLLRAPEGLVDRLGPLRGVRIKRQARGPADRILLFARNLADLERRWPRAAEALSAKGAIWICWPKKSGPLAGDLGGNEVRAFGLARDFVDYKICAIDETWSGLCFARR